MESSLLGEALPSSQDGGDSPDHQALTEHLIQLVELRKAAAKVKDPGTGKYYHI